MCGNVPIVMCAIDGVVAACCAYVPIVMCVFIVFLFSWVSPSSGVCTLRWLAGYARESPPYSGSNTNPDIGEAVGSTTIGSTCNFNSHSAAKAAMPYIYRQNYVLAASQDVYAGD